MIRNLIILCIVLVAVGGVAYVAKERLFYTYSINEKDTSLAGKLPSENVLDLSGRGLSKVPIAVFDKVALIELNLSNNRLDGALQSQVGQLKNLKVLNLSNNKFTGVPAEIGQLKDLEVLDLSNNLLTGLPNELGNLSNLKLLDVSGNKYSEADLSGIRAKLPQTTVIKTK